MNVRPVSAARDILSAYKGVLEVPLDAVTSVGVSVPIPRFCPDILILLVEEFVNSSRDTPAVVHLQNDAVVVGDIHGNLHNLLVILAMNGMPPSTKYIFLGNLIDYGEFSIEVVTLLLALKVVHPTSVLILRGLSELCPLNTINGLCEEIENTYGGRDVWNAFKRAFTYFPLMCVLKDEICLCHLRMLMNYPVVTEIEGLRLPIESREETYQEFTDVTDHLDSDSCNTFCNINDFGFVVCGGDSDSGVIQVTEDSKGFAISSCESESDATVFVLENDKMSPILFKTPKQVQRLTAKFIDLAVGMGTKHITACVSERLHVTPSTDEMNPLKSYA